jgi:alpha-1,2-mannosyltransferase
MDSLPPVLKRHWPLAGVALLCAVYGWALVAATGSGHDGAIGPHFNALGADWVIFLAAGRAIFNHDLGHIYDQAWITDAVNSQFAHWLSGPEPFPLFPYPPVFLLLVAPFALLPVALSLILSQLLQFAALAWALRQFAPNRSWLFLVTGAALAPAASNNVLAGSNAMLVAALVVGGIASLEKKPLVAGVLLGLVIFKPQFVPLLVVALVAGGYWRALGAAAVTAVLFAAVSVIAFGPSLWLDWMNVYLHPQIVHGVNATDWGHMWDDSVSTCAALLGAPHWLALAAQCVAVIVAVVAVWRVFGDRSPAQLPILLCAGLLAAPHVSNYDLIGLAIAALALVQWLPATTRLIMLMLPLAAYAAALFNPPRALSLGLITPLILLAMIAVLGRATVTRRRASQTPAGLP